MIYIKGLIDAAGKVRPKLQIVTRNGEIVSPELRAKLGMPDEKGPRRKKPPAKWVAYET
jgi:hypothetical protein